MPSFASSSSSSSPLPPAAASAVAALDAAGTDLDALAVAIGAAAFLDGTLGSARQALRAARTRLRKALSDAAAKAQAAAASAAADASPFAKPSYDDAEAEFPALSSAFESLAWRAIAKPGGATVKPDPYYELAALHAQGKTGDVTGERPMWAERGGLDFDGRARWDAHAALKGVSREGARLRFVKLYWEFSPRALYSEGRGKK